MLTEDLFYLFFFQIVVIWNQNKVHKYFSMYKYIIMHTRKANNAFYMSNNAQAETYFKWK